MNFNKLSIFFQYLLLLDWNDWAHFLKSSFNLQAGNRSEAASWTLRLVYSSTRLSWTRSEQWVRCAEARALRDCRGSAGRENRSLLPEVRPKRAWSWGWNQSSSNFKLTTQSFKRQAIPTKALTCTIIPSFQSYAILSTCRFVKK